VGFDVGALACTALCTFDTSDCDYTCGDGELDPGEACDGAAFPIGTACSVLDPTTQGAPGCAADCSLTTEQCVAIAFDETEPNDDASSADLVPPDDTFVGLLAPGDTDCVSFAVSKGESDLYVDFGDLGDGACASGLPQAVFTVTDPSGGSILYGAMCGVSTGSYLAPGSYILCANSYASAPFPYALTVEASAMSCGNGVASGNEQCDDGNTVAGDGCSESCTLES
jgi:cysteine-rich repeat protein